MDTSCLVAVAFGEPGTVELAEVLESFDTLLSSNLLEAELRAALAREEVDEEPAALSWLTWVLPDRPLGPEIRRALTSGYARGADVWHVATALYVAETPRELPFLSLDAAQVRLAESLGFPTPL